MAIGSAMSVAAAGMQNNMFQFDRAAARIATPTDEQVDLGAEFASAMEAKHGVMSNVQVVKSADEMLGSLLDILA